MLKQIYRIDEFGYLKEIYVKDFGEDGNCVEEIAENIITVDPPQGLYKLKWTGTEWIEGLTQEEINEINNQPKPLTEIEQLRLEQAQANTEMVELILAMILGGL